MWRPVARGKAADGFAQGVQYSRFAGRDDGVHGVEPQPVEAVMVEPVQRIVDGEGTDIGVAVIDRAAPRGLRVGEELRRDAGEVISLRAEVIVDDVEKHHQPARMRGVDQRLEVLGPAVTAVRRERQHAVIAPVPAAGKIRQRHQLERGNAGRGEVVEPVGDGAECALARERTDMHLGKHRLAPRAGRPNPRHCQS